MEKTTPVSSMYSASQLASSPCCTPRGGDAHPLSFNSKPRDNDINAILEEIELLLNTTRRLNQWTLRARKRRLANLQASNFQAQGHHRLSITSCSDCKSPSSRLPSRTRPHDRGDDQLEALGNRLAKLKEQQQQQILQHQQ